MDVVLFFLDGSMSPPTKHHLFNQEFNYAFTWAARDWPPALTSAGKKPPPPRPTADGYAQPPCSRSGTGPAGFSGGAQVRPREKGGEPWRESGVGANRKKRSKTWCEGTAAPGSTENTERRFPPTRCGDTVSPEMEIRSPGVRLPGDARSAALFISVVENLLNGRTQTPTPELMSDSAFLLICPFFLHFLLFERKQFELICWALPNMVFIIIHLTSYLASFIKTCLKKNSFFFVPLWPFSSLNDCRFSFPSYHQNEHAVLPLQKLLKARLPCVNGWIVLWRRSPQRVPPLNL